MVSIIIPSRNEKYLKRTIEELLEKAVEEIEIIVVLDGYWPPPEDIINKSNVHYIHFSDPRGMRSAINKGVAVARGDYIMKIDAHCMVCEGFDLLLRANCEDNWVVVPTRKRLDPEKWEVIEDGRPDINHMYLSYPDDPSVWGGSSLQGKEWREKNLGSIHHDNSHDENMFVNLVDLMTAQGSCWFMKRDYYHWLELMDEENYGEFAKEMQEIGLKCWLSGGRMVRNRKTWYAHWHKPKSHGRGYSLNKSEWKKGTEYTARWVTDYLKGTHTWIKQIHDFKFIIDRFWPIPGWPEDWRDK